jgi:hypothetical protein
MVSAAVACLPAAVSLLLLVALFMQISGVSLALTWPRRLCLFRVLLCVSLCYMRSPFQALGKVTLHPHSQACVFIYSSCGRWVFPPSPVEFPSHRHFNKLSCSWLLGGAAAHTSCHVCLQFTWEVGLPSFPVEFSSLHHSYKLSRSWLLGACPCSCQSLSGLPGLFIYSPGKDFLPPVFGAQWAPPSFPCVFIVLIDY